MFEIRCIVADKRLAEVLRMLRPIAIEPPVSIPVGSEMETSLNGATPNRGLRIKGQNATVLVCEYLKTNKLKTVTANQLCKLLVGFGYSDNGYSYALKRLLEKGVLAKTKTTSTYKVVKDSK